MKKIETSKSKCSEKCLGFDGWTCVCGVKGCSEHILDHDHEITDPIQIIKNSEGVPKHLRLNNFLTYKNIFILPKCLKTRSVSMHDSFDCCFLCFKECNFYKVLYKDTSDDFGPAVKIEFQKVDLLDKHFYRFYHKFYKQVQIRTISAMSDDQNYAIHIESSWEKEQNKVKITNFKRNKLFTIVPNLLCIKSLFITKDSKQFVLGSSDNLITIWSIKKGIKKLEIKGHTNWVSCVTTTTDKKYLISGSYDKTIRVWEFKTGKNISVIKVAGCNIFHLISSNNNQYLFSGGSDSNIYIWALSDFSLHTTLKGHFLAISSLDIFKNDQILVSGGYDGKVITWNLKTFEIDKVFDNLQKKVLNASQICKGKFIYATSPADRASFIWNFSDKKIVYACARLNGFITSAGLSTDKNWAVLGFDCGNIVFFDLNNKKKKILHADTNEINSVIISHDNQLILAVCGYQHFKIWKIEDFYEVFETKLEEKILKIGILKNKKFAYAIDCENNYHLFNIFASKVEKNKKKKVRHVKFSRKFHELTIFKKKIKLK